MDQSDSLTLNFNSSKAEPSSRNKGKGSKWQGQACSKTSSTYHSILTIYKVTPEVC